MGLDTVERLLAMTKRLDERFEAWKHRWNERYTQAMAELANTKGRKWREPGPDTTAWVFEKYPEDAEILRNRIHEEARPGANRYKARQRRLEDLLTRVAQDVALTTDLSVTTEVACVWASTYSTQGGGADKYARERARAKADHYVAVGVLAVAVKRDGDYFVLAHCSPLAKIVAELQPGLPLREVIRRYWARGVNPRVYYPSLPPNYEAEVGINHFGHDLREGTVA